MAKYALYVPLKARPGQESAVEAFLKQGAEMAGKESGTRTWYGLKEGEGQYAVFDTFDDEAGRDTHMNGEIAKALMAKADELFSEPPKIHKIDVLATKSTFPRVLFGLTVMALVATVSPMRGQTQSSGQGLPHDVPVGRLETVATFSGPMPTGVTVSRSNRVFVNFPRWGDDVPFTVAEVVHGKAVAYPDAAINDWPGRTSADPTTYGDEGQNQTHFVSVQSVVVDPADRMWVLDTGSPLLKNALPGGPKLVAIDLATNKIVKRILLPPSVAGPTSYMNDVRFDLRVGSPAGADGIHGIAYITDSSEKGPTGLVIVDLATGQAWRALDNDKSVKPEAGFLMFAMGRPLYKTEPGQPAKPSVFGNDSIAISEDGSRLFFCPVSSTKLYSVPTAALRDRNLSSDRVAAQVELVTGKESSDGLESDAEGNVYATAPASGSILKISPNAAFAGGVEVTTLVHDPRLLWPDTMSLSEDGYLYVTANQLFNQPSMHNGKDLRQRPYVLFRVKVNARPVRLQ